MQSSTDPFAGTPDQAGIGDPCAVAAALLGRPVLTAETVHGGRNSRVYRIDTASGRFALKRYASHAGGHDRFGTETTAFAFLESHGVTAVPRLVAADRELAAALYGWVDGGPVLPAGPADIDAALAFVSQLRDLASAGDAQRLPPAAEACLSVTELATQIERRRRWLLDQAADRLGGFLEDGVAPVLAAAIARADQLLAPLGLSRDTELALGLRTLSPSDFGFHNARRRPDGRLAFLDLEYFGWDDPVKLTADFLLHPGMELDRSLRRQFRAGAEAVFARDPSFAVRLGAALPLYALRWCMIVLNEFLPERWRQRLHAGVAEEREALLAVQEAKAARLLAFAARYGN